VVPSKLIVADPELNRHPLPLEKTILLTVVVPNGAAMVIKPSLELKFRIVVLLKVGVVFQLPELVNE
jgi:hypothetical protein